MKLPSKLLPPAWIFHEPLSRRTRRREEDEEEEEEELGGGGDGDNENVEGHKSKRTGLRLNRRPQVLVAIAATLLLQLLFAAHIRNTEQLCNGAGQFQSRKTRAVATSHYLTIVLLHLRKQRARSFAAASRVAHVDALVCLVATNCTMRRGPLLRAD